MASPKKPLIIDCQVFQTASWHRGMGKYSRAFVEAICRHDQLKEDYKFKFLFTNQRDKNDEIEQAINEHYPDAEIIYADLDTPKEPRTENSVAPVIAANKTTLAELFADDFKQGADFLILALYLDEVCPAFPDDASEKMLIYYDAIPYLYHERYGQFAGFFDNFYMPHTATVYEATKLLTISKTVANDLHVMFGLPEDSIHDIDGASIPRAITNVSEPAELGVQSDSFILMPTGQELRKNNLRAIRAFEQWRVNSGGQTKLVVTSHFTEEAREELGALSDHVIFSGNVSEGEMLWLFQNCKFVFFPSEYEGLGLPILEAVEQYKPIACSDISVFREMSKTAFNFFDPLNVDSIAETLEIVASKKAATAIKPADYDAVLKRYTWDNTAKLFATAVAQPSYKSKVPKKKIAIFCPEPSGFSAIGKVVTESHAWYARYFDITYYYDAGPNHESIRPDLLSFLAPSFSVEDFMAEDYDRFDGVIYHIGNSEYHLETIHTALAFPGYVILHDTYLSGAYANLGELGYMSDKRLAFETKLDKLLVDENPEGLPKSTNLTSIINNQLAVVTHSEYASKAVKSKLINDKTKVQKINLPVDTPIFTDIVRTANKRLNIAFAGIIAKVKGTDIIENIAISEQFSDCNIKIFGYSAVEPERLEKLRSLHHVKLVTNPNDHEFQTLMSSTDLLINVRLAYKGETSLTTLEAMRYGVGVVVRDFGWYGELPDDTVIKVEQPDHAIDALRDALEDPKKLAEIRDRAQKHIQENYSHDAYAEGMYKLIKSD